MKWYIDPPMGSKYGFPKEIIKDEQRTEQWWLDKGYPQELIDAGMLKYVRIFPKEDNE